MVSRTSSSSFSSSSSSLSPPRSSRWRCSDAWCLTSPHPQDSQCEVTRFHIHARRYVRKHTRLVRVKYMLEVPEQQAVVRSWLELYTKSSRRL